MTTLPDLPPSSEATSDDDLFFTVQPSGPRKRSFGNLWRNIFGLTPATARAFFGAAPVSQPASANQAAVTATVGAAVATTSATNTTPYGFTTATQPNDIVARVNQLRADVLALTTLVNQMRADLVALGLIKGGA